MLNRSLPLLLYES
nr:unnamed protein product [Callosobruchus analis]